MAIHQPFSAVISTVCLSLLAIPISIAVDILPLSSPVTLALLAVLICGAVALFGATLVSGGIWCTVFSVFAFTSVIDLLLALEIYGVIDGVAKTWLTIAERYLNTHYGGAINLWDVPENVTFMKLGHFWAGSVLNSITVLFLGAIKSKYDFTLSAVLNVPYVIAPITFLYLHSDYRRHKSRYQTHNFEWLGDGFLLLMLTVVSVFWTTAQSAPSFSEEPFVHAQMFVNYKVAILFMCCILGKWTQGCWSAFLAGIVCNGSFGIVCPYFLHAVDDVSVGFVDNGYLYVIFPLLSVVYVIYAFRRR